MVEIVEIGTFVMVIVKVTTQGTAERIFARRTSTDPLAEEALAIHGLPVSVRAHLQPSAIAFLFIQL